jgi:hypothetical protein
MHASHSHPAALFPCNQVDVRLINASARPLCLYEGLHTRIPKQDPDNKAKTPPPSLTPSVGCCSQWDGVGRGATYMGCQTQPQADSFRLTAFVENQSAPVMGLYHAAITFILFLQCWHLGGLTCRVPYNRRKRTSDDICDEFAHDSGGIVSVSR